MSHRHLRLYLVTVFQFAGAKRSVSLTDLKRYEEARSIQRKVIPAALRILGPEADTTLLLLRTNVRSVFSDPKATLADLRQAERSMRDVWQRTRRIERVV